MIVSCPSCQRNYVVADDQIAGKQFRARCKSCGVEFRLDGTPSREGSGGAPSPEPAKFMSATEAYLALQSTPPPSAGTWSVCVSQTDTRRMTTDEVAQALNKGTITPSVFVWKNGMPKWLRLADVPELMAAGKSAARTTGAAAGDAGSATKSDASARASKPAPPARGANTASLSQPPAAGAGAAISARSGQTAPPPPMVADPVAGAPNGVIASNPQSLAPSAGAARRSTPAPPRRALDIPVEVELPSVEVARPVDHAPTAEGGARGEGQATAKAAAAPATGANAPTTSNSVAAPAIGANVSTTAKAAAAPAIGATASTTSKSGGATNEPLATANDETAASDAAMRETAASDAPRRDGTKAEVILPPLTQSNAGSAPTERGAATSGAVTPMAASKWPVQKKYAQDAQSTSKASASEAAVALPTSRPPEASRKKGIAGAVMAMGAVGLVGVLGGVAGAAYVMKSAVGSKPATFATAAVVALQPQAATPVATPAVSAVPPSTGDAVIDADATSPPTVSEKPKSSGVAPRTATATAVKAAKAEPLPPNELPRLPTASDSKVGTDAKAKAATTTPAAGPFNRDAALAVLGLAAARASSCKKPDGPTGTAKVYVTFDPNGSVVIANVVGSPIAGTSVAQCVANVFRRVKVTPFVGDRSSLSRDVTIPP